MEPTVSDNFLTQIDTNNVPASFTLVFSKPLKSFTFLLPMLWPATASGITFPAWKAIVVQRRNPGIRLREIVVGRARAIAT